MIQLPSLYPHQEDIRDRTREALQNHRRVILTAPPGVGKTRIAKWILGASANREPCIDQSGHSLFTVHRRGLVDNASNSFREDPPLRHGVIMSGVKPAYGARVQVASIDTLLSWFLEGGQYDTSITFDLIVFDECVSGDSVVETDLGAMRIDEIPERRPSLVKTYSESRGVHFSKILNWQYSGFRETIVLHTLSGKIRCTPDHEIYTRRGWLQAQFVSLTDEILACVDVDVSREKVRCSHGDTSNGPTALRSISHGRNCTRMRHCVCADAGRRSVRHSLRRKNGFRADYQRNTTSSPTATKIARRTKISCSRHLSVRRFSGHSSATLPSATRTATPTTLVCRARTATSSFRGRNTRRNSCTASRPRRASLSMAVMVKCPSALSLHAIHASRRYSTSFTGEAESVCPVNGSKASETLALRGGYVTTEAPARSRLCSTPKHSQQRNASSSPGGSATRSEEPLSAASKDGTPSTFPVGRKSQSVNVLDHTSPNACDTNWQRVTRIDRANAVDVYDIAVEGSHCFFANGLLVHNCHSHHAKLQKFLEHHDAYRESLGLHPAFVIGLTATPEAKGLADVYREIVLGPPTQWLIDNRFLSPFRYFRATQGRLGLLVKRGGEFTEESVSNAMAGLSGDLVRDWKRFADGRPTVGFFPRRSHAQEAKAELEAAGLRVAYVDGETDDISRARMFWELNNHKIDYLCNVQVVERGTDIPRIGCVQLCTAIGSLVRYRQMIGRGSRVHPEKTDCLVLDHGGSIKRHGFFEDDPLWSLDRSKQDVGEIGTRPTIECPNCQAIYRGGKCRQCGYEPTPKERRSQGLEFDGSELQEVTRKEKGPKQVKDAETMMLMSLYKAGKTGRTWKQAVGMFLGMAKQQGTKYRVPKRVTVGGHAYQMLPYGHPESGRRVGDLFPFTVERGNHGGAFLDHSL